MGQLDPQLAPITEHLKRLMLLRSALACALALTICVVVLGFGIDLRLNLMTGIVLLLPAANLVARVRIRRGGGIREIEFFLQLLLDIAVLSALLYLSGGSTNPFVSLYLLPLVIAATTLPPPYAWSTAAVTVTCYGLLFFINLPLNGIHSGHGEAGFHLHLVGMWVNFVLSAGFIAFFVVRMAQAIRTRDAQLTQQKEEALRGERIVALGTLAAGAAHELGTPLSTMAVVLGEMAKDHSSAPDLTADIAMLRRQVDICKQTITRMVSAAGQARAEGGGAEPLDRFLRDTLERWRLVRPAVTVSERLTGPAPAPEILSEQTLRQAIMNLLNNAADASPREVELECDWNRERLRLEIRDRGPGLSGEARQQIAGGFFTTKPQGQGNGIGLLLARATLERLGGRVSLTPREGGGVCTLMELPLSTLVPGGRI
jgi:two-component system sensor histidine kinase RegB